LRTQSPIKHQHTHTSITPPPKTDRAERSRKDAIAQVAIWKAQDVARQVISFCDDIKDQAERAERKAEKLYVRLLCQWNSKHNRTQKHKQNTDTIK